MVSVFQGALMRSRSFVLFLTAAILLVVVVYARLLLPGAASAQVYSKAVEFDVENYQPHKVVRAFPAIIDPPHFPAIVANERLSPSELVLGVEIDGVARAYPINMLTGPSREIFNDQLGEHRIAATW